MKERMNCVECNRQLTGKWIECDLCRHITNAKSTVDRFWRQHEYPAIAGMIRGFAGDIKSRHLEAIQGKKHGTASLCASIRRNAESAKVTPEEMARMVADRLDSDTRNLAALESTYAESGGWRKQANQAVAAINREVKEAMIKNNANK